MRSDRAIASLIAFTLAALAVAFYTAVALRSLKRDKAVSYWIDRRELRLELGRMEAQMRLSARMLEAVRRLDAEPGPGTAQSVLLALVDDVYSMVSRATGVDAAVVLALEANRRHRVLHAATSRRSRWLALEPGKCCSADRPLLQILAELAPHHRECEVATPHGWLRAVVLSEASLDVVGDSLFEAFETCLGLLATRWSPSAMQGEPRIALVQ